MSNQPSVNIEKIGLKNYLESTKVHHNNQGYDQFIFYLRPELKLGHTAIGRLMNVTRNTIRRWVAVHDKENTTHGSAK